MKVFISQPMSGLTKEEVLLQRGIAEDWLKAKYKNVEILDSYFEDKKPDKIVYSGVYWLGQSLELMAEADMVAFIPGWDKARGCKLEYEVAKEYGLIKEILNQSLFREDK